MILESTQIKKKYSPAKAFNASLSGRIIMMSLSSPPAWNPQAAPDDKIADGALHAPFDPRDTTNPGIYHIELKLLNQVYTMGSHSSKHNSITKNLTTGNVYVP